MKMEEEIISEKFRCFQNSAIKVIKLVQYCKMIKGNFLLYFIKVLVKNTL